MSFRKLRQLFTQKLSSDVKADRAPKDASPADDDQGHRPTTQVERERTEKEVGLSAQVAEDAAGVSPTPQQVGKTPERDRLQLVVGLDFGTAFTKVVLGETRAHFAVPFERYSDGVNPYLLPGRYFVDSSGVCSLGNNAGREVSNLKMRVLDGHCSDRDEGEIAAFMALVLRQARTWMLKENQNIYGQSNIDWVVNIGLPTHSYDDKDLANFYQHLVRTAWFASQGQKPITLENVEDWLVKLACEPATNSFSDALADESIGLFPEFVAQITGYVRSTRMQDDLHLLIDVGAGTVDISIFNVMERDDERRFPIFARAVERLGTAYLLKRRLAATGRILNGNIAAFDSVPSRNVFVKRFGASEKKISAVDSELREGLYAKIIKRLRYTKDRRYQESRRWREGVPTFLCGGGARVDVYQELGQWLDRRGGDIKLRLIPLELPDDLKAPLADESSYDRLSVAYGLSFDPFDIGEIIKASEIEDEPPPNGGPEAEYVSWYK